MNTLTISSRDGVTVATFVPEAGMVCCSLRHRGDELLEERKGLEAYAATGATMGIPLLYPWANRLGGFDYLFAGQSVTLPSDQGRIAVDPNGLPIHGVVPGLMHWQPAKGDGDAAVIAARLDWSTGPLLELFPFRHEACLEAAVDTGSLTVSVAVRASGEDAVPVSFGFHPYLRLAQADRSRLRVQLPAARKLVLDERMIPTGERESVHLVSFDLAGRSLDDAFQATSSPSRLAISAVARGARPDRQDQERDIAVELREGFGYFQLYAPSDSDFICFEPMTAPTDALRSGDGLSIVQPGGEYRASFRISWTGG